MASKHTIICPHCGREIELPVGEENPRSRGSAGKLAACIIVSIIICAVGFGIYMHGEQQRETDSWELAMASDDAMTLHAYLDTYRQAPLEHRTQAEKRLRQLELEADDWRKAYEEGTVAALMDFSRQHPDSHFASIATARADSLRYVAACMAGSADDFAAYLQAFPNGRYAAEAKEKKANAEAATVYPEDQIAAEMVAGELIRAVSQHDGERLEALMTDTLSSYLGRKYVPKAHVSTLITKLNSTTDGNINWMEPTNIIIKKSKSNASTSSITANLNVEFTAERTVQSATAIETKHYKFILVLSPQGRISAIEVAEVKK